MSIGDFFTCWVISGSTSLSPKWYPDEKIFSKMLLKAVELYINTSCRSIFESEIKNFFRD